MMKTIDLNHIPNKRVALALGFFDALHLGHQRLINAVLAYASSHEMLSAVFTFSDNPFAKFSEQKPLVYPFSARQKIIDGMGVDLIVAPRFSLLCDVAADDFLDMLVRLRVGMIACGRDYRFGKGGSGDVELLKKFAAANDIVIEVAPDVKINQIKVSSTVIRGGILQGDIEGVYNLLGREYAIYALKREPKIFPDAFVVQDGDQTVQLMDGIYDVYYIDKSTKIYTECKIKDGLISLDKNAPNKIDCLYFVGKGAKK